MTLLYIVLFGTLTTSALLASAGAHGGRHSTDELDVPWIDAVTVLVGAPEQMGGPTGSLYDSPFASFRLPNGTVRGFSANQVTMMVMDGVNSTAGVSLTTPRAVNLTRSPSPQALDHCGAWLNAVLMDGSDDDPLLVRGWYHEEWECDYARNSYTNKSVAYAESHDGGSTFTKVGWPHNQVILPPAGNTTTAHQTGEGDHGVACNGQYCYLWFREWDPPTTAGTIGVARATRSSGGVPGSWYKFKDGAWTEPGVGGESTAVGGAIPGTAVYYRRDGDDFVGIGSAGCSYPLPTLGWSRQPHQGWQCLDEPLLHLDGNSWKRSNTSGELVAYTALSGLGGGEDFPSGDGTGFLWYTYLEPGATFADRYLVRRSLTLAMAAEAVGADVPQVTVALSLYRRASAASPDHWATTALVPASRQYEQAEEVLCRLMTSAVAANPSGNATLPLLDCLNEATGDHMVGATAAECSKPGVRLLRTLGWVFRVPTHDTSPLTRCYSGALHDHSVAVGSSCPTGYEAEFVMGHALQ